MVGEWCEDRVRWREGRLDVLRYEVPDRLTVIKSISNVFRDREGQGRGRGLGGSGMLD